MFTKVKLQRGVTLYMYNSDQFKTVSFSLKWKTDISEEVAASRTVLANVLEDSNKKYPTQSALRNQLDDLYGTVLYTDTAKRGDTHIFSLNVECVNGEYVDKKDVLEETMQLMHDVIFEPNIQDGQFVESTVEREKQTVIGRIQSQYDNKTSYAQKRMLEVLRPHSVVSTSADGTTEAVSQITAASLMQTYETMLAEDEIAIYVVGAIDEEAMTEQVRRLFAFEDRVERTMEPVAIQAPRQQEIEKVQEQQEMKQGKLHLGFSTPITFYHEDYVKMQVMNGIFGGFAHSKLFMNVREKESMAYYASSSYASHYGLLYVMAGIDAELEEKAVQLIVEQLKEMQNGVISDLELEQTIALLKNSILSSFDSARGQIELFDQFKALNDHFTAQDLMDAWDQVTKEDVQRMANTVTLEVVYLLSGKEAVSNA